MKSLLLILIALCLASFAFPRYESQYSNLDGTRADQRAASIQAQGCAAQFSLGFLYAIGAGVAENDIEAVRWYRLAAEQGDSMAQLNLGDMYVNGEGVPQNYRLGYVWFSVAAAQGNQVARDNRDIVVNSLTPEQPALAQEQATRCFESDFQDCE